MELKHSKKITDLLQILREKYKSVMQALKTMHLYCMCPACRDNCIDVKSDPMEAKANDRYALQHKNALENLTYEIDSVGMSGSGILLFTDRVLKIREDLDEARNEAQAMQWLAGRLAVPEVIAHEYKDGKSYLLITRVAGRMACDNRYMNNPEKLTELLAHALQQLWRIDISACPLDQRLDRKLEVARFRVENNLVDTEYGGEEYPGFDPQILF